MAIARVNTDGAFTAGSSTTTASPAFVATAGNLIVVAFRQASFATSSVADTAGNYYRPMFNFNSGGTFSSYWACWTCLGHATNVITGTNAGSSGSRGVAFVQYSGIDTRPIDVYVQKAGAVGSTITSPTFTTSDAAALILSFVQVDATGSTWTPGGGATKFVSSATSEVIMGMELIVASVQTATTAATNCTSTSGIFMMTAVFAATRAAGGGGASSYPFIG